MRREPQTSNLRGPVGQWLRDVAALTGASIALSGCVFIASEVEPVPPQEPEVAVVEPAPTPPPPAAPKAPEPPPPSESTAIVLSQDIPAFSEIADEIRRLLPAEHVVTIHNLAGRQTNAERVVAELAEVDPDRMIAIGLLAATVASRIPETPMVFCQVYNHADYGLISPRAKGVSFLPPFDIQIDAWKKISPDLRSVGVITGPGQEALIEEIRKATADASVQLLVRTADTDQEALFNFKTLTPDIQGLWLLPDNRILSPEIVREIMSYAAKHRRQVVVFGENLLGLGALMSIETDYADVAERALARFDALQANGQLGGPDMLPLTQMHVRPNSEVADYLGLIVPEQLADSGSAR